jgi:2-oxo-4-hydroxy-4-carboxy-5-ureidoimidazoline decarboxylase
MEPWQRLNEAGDAEARAMLATCCGSSRWIERMLTRRPFADQPALLAAARDEWEALGENDWREAFAHHPRIGDRASLERRFPTTAGLSAGEQRGVDRAAPDVIAALAEANDAYVRRFGYIFIVRASGRSAEEMLEALRARLHNEPATELRVAAGAQAEITALRLNGLR